MTGRHPCHRPCCIAGMVESLTGRSRRYRCDVTGEAGGGSEPSDYRPPAPFAPPAYRTPPMNEREVLGRSSYPGPPPFLQPATQAWLMPSPPPPPPPMSDAAKHASRTRHRTTAVVVTLAVALVAVVAALLVGSTSTHRARSLSLPDTAGGYVKLSTISGSRITTILGSSGTFGTIPNDDVAHAKVGIYGRGPQSAPSLLFIGFNASDSPTLGRQLRSEDPRHVTEDVLDGAGAASTALTVDAGPLGGSLRCGAVRMDGVDAAVGVWADPDTLGMVLVIDPVAPPSVSRTGEVTREFRGKAEH